MTKEENRNYELVEREKDYKAWIVVKDIPPGKVNPFFDVRAGGGYFEVPHELALSDPHVRPTHCLRLREIYELVEEEYLIEEIK